MTVPLNHEFNYGLKQMHFFSPKVMLASAIAELLVDSHNVKLRERKKLALTPFGKLTEERKTKATSAQSE